MFDVGFSEMVVIAVVALVVIGPERLPTVARTVGALLGRLNRYVADVKSDVEREMRLEEMKKLRAEVEQQAESLEQSMSKEMLAAREALQQPAHEIHQSLAEVMVETGQTGVEIQQAVLAPPGESAEQMAQASPAEPTVAIDSGDLQKNADNATSAPEMAAKA